jgi:hypothetical protein
MSKLPLPLGPGKGQHATLTYHRNWYTVTLSPIFVGDERLDPEGNKIEKKTKWS